MLSPFDSSVGDLLSHGWAPLPLPEGAKFPPPAGSTGRYGRDLTEEALGNFVGSRGNIGVRLSPNTIGIDFDLYHNRHAKRQLEARLGALPASVGVSARGMQESFTAFFNVPTGTTFKSSANFGVDIIQNSHRYSTTAPSLHPSGSSYKWIETGEGRTLPYTPDSESLPPLPASWLEDLTIATPALITPLAALITLPTGVWCAATKACLTGAFRLLGEGNSSRHDSMVRSVFALVSTGAKGHSGTQKALDSYLGAWKNKFSSAEQIARPLNFEFESAVFGAHRRALIEPSNACNCGKKPVRSSSRIKMFD